MLEGGRFEEEGPDDANRMFPSSLRRSFLREGVLCSLIMDFLGVGAPSL